MMRSRILRIGLGLLLVGGLAVSVSNAAATDMPDMMPADTLLYINWPGADKLSETSKGTAMGDLLAEPEVVRFRERLIPSLWKFLEAEARKENDADKFSAVMTILSNAWHHPVALGVIGVGMGPEGPQVDACLVVRAGDQAKEVAKQVEALLKDCLPLDEAKEVAVGEAKLKEVVMPQAGIPLRWGVLAQDFVVAIGSKAIEHWSAGAAAKGLSGSERFKAAMKATGGSATAPVFYLDLRGVAQSLEKFQPLFATAGLPILGEEGGVQKVLDQIHMGKMESLAAATVPDANGYKTTVFMHCPGMLEGPNAAPAGKPITDADLKIVPKDASWATVSRMDLAGAYRNLMEGIQGISPGAYAAVMAAVTTFEGRIGMSVEKDLLGSFGDSWTIYDAPSNGGLWITGITVVAKVQPENKLDAGMKALVEMIADATGGREAVSLHEEQYRDQKITFLNVSGIPMPIAPAWAQYKDQLILALYPQMVRAALDRMIDGKDSILDNPDFVRGRKIMPANAESISYVDTVAGIQQVYGFVLPIAQMAMAMAQKEGVDIDVSLVPSSKTVTRHLFGNVSASVMTNDGVLTVSHGALPVGIPAVAAGGSVVATATMTAILLPSLARARELSKRTVSAANLHGIGVAIHTYANDHDGKCPPDLKTLVKEGSISDKALISPRDCTGAESSYLYLPQSLNGDVRNVLAYENPEIEGGEDGTNVLFLDAHVEWMNAGAFSKALSETKDRLRKGNKSATSAGSDESAPRKKPRPAKKNKE